MNKKASLLFSVVDKKSYLDLYLLDQSSEIPIGNFISIWEFLTKAFPIVFAIRSIEFADLQMTYSLKDEIEIIHRNHSCYHLEITHPRNSVKALGISFWLPGRTDNQTPVYHIPKSTFGLFNALLNTVTTVDTKIVPTIPIKKQYPNLLIYPNPTKIVFPVCRAITYCNSVNRYGDLI